MRNKLKIIGLIVFISLICELVVVCDLQAQDLTDDMYFNYRAEKIFYYENPDDRLAAGLIPQHSKALDTYKWYRTIKKYTVKKSIRLTIKYWALKLKGN